MMEDASEVFEQALDLEWPWYVDRVWFDDESRKDTMQKQWGHLDSFQYQTFLHGLSPRVGLQSARIAFRRLRTK